MVSIKMTSIKKISSKEHNIDLRLSKISSFDLSALTVYMPPLKLEKIRFFGVKSWFLTRNTPKIFAPPSAIGNNMIFWRKIVIFHTKYPKNFRASLRSAQFFLSAPPP